MTEHREEPGKFPFTRGIHATMYRGKLWTMRQYAGFGTATETNKRYQYLLSQGQTGLSMAFDLPTQHGVIAPVRWGCAVLGALYVDRQIVVELLHQEEQPVSPRRKGIVHEEQVRPPRRRGLDPLQFRDHSPGGKLHRGESLQRHLRSARVQRPESQRYRQKQHRRRDPLPRPLAQHPERRGCVERPAEHRQIHECARVVRQENERQYAEQHEAPGKQHGSRAPRFPRPRSGWRRDAPRPGSSRRKSYRCFPCPRAVPQTSRSQSPLSNHRLGHHRRERA